MYLGSEKDVSVIRSGSGRWVPTLTSLNVDLVQQFVNIIMNQKDCVIFTNRVLYFYGCGEAVIHSVVIAGIWDTMINENQNNDLQLEP